MEPFRAPKISRRCRLPLLFHPPLRQGGDLRLLAAFPCKGGLASAKPTRNPFMNLWVKALANAHHRINPQSFSARGLELLLL